MTLHYNAMYVLLMVVCMHHSTKGQGFPTCDLFGKYGPLLSKMEQGSGHTLISLQSGQLINASLVANVSLVKQVGESSLMVINHAINPDPTMIVNAKTGEVQANEEIMKTIGVDTLFKDHLVVTIHDDRTMITYNIVEGKAFNFNLTTGETENSTQLHNYSSNLKKDVFEPASLAVRDGKYCIIGGSYYEERPMVCYDKSNRKWTTSKKMKIKRAFHSSLWFNGVLYVCGGMIGYDSYVDTCSLYNTYHDFIRKIPIACGPSVGGRLFVVGDALNYVAIRKYQNKVEDRLFMWSVSKLGRPSNCMDIGIKPGDYDTIIYPFCPSIELTEFLHSDRKSVAKKQRLSILFIVLLMPFWI